MNQPDRTTRVFAAVLAIGGIFGVVNGALALSWGIGVICFRPQGIGFYELLVFGFAAMFVWATDTRVLAWQGARPRDADAQSFSLLRRYRFSVCRS